MTGEHEPSREQVAMPEPTVWPLVVAAAVTLVAAGVVTHLALSVVGGVLLVLSLAGWVGQLLPGRGHVHEPLVEPGRRARPASPAPGAVERMVEGLPGYRFQLPLKIHPIAAGVRGGLVGGLVMLLPALAYGVLSGHGPWFPVNLLAGMALPGVEELTVAELEQPHLGFLLLGVVIHVTSSLGMGLMYGVLLPTLPFIPKPLAWGGLLMPVLWTGVTYLGMAVVNPVLHGRVDWPSFILAQFLFGVVAALVVMRARRRRRAGRNSPGGSAGRSRPSCSSPSTASAKALGPSGPAVRHDPRHAGLTAQNRITGITAPVYRSGPFPLFLPRFPCARIAAVVGRNGILDPCPWPGLRSRDGRDRDGGPASTPRR
jgi:hypothetical protein